MSQMVTADQTVQRLPVAFELGAWRAPGSPDVVAVFGILAESAVAHSGCKAQFVVGLARQAHGQYLGLRTWHCEGILSC